MNSAGNNAHKVAKPARGRGAATAALAHGCDWFWYALSKLGGQEHSESNPKDVTSGRSGTTAEFRNLFSPCGHKYLVGLSASTAYADLATASLSDSVWSHVSDSFCLGSIGNRLGAPSGLFTAFASR